MSKHILVGVFLATAVTGAVWAFWAVNIPPDEVIGSKYKRTFRVVSSPMLTQVSDVADGTAIFWYNSDHGPRPTKIERTADGEWVITLKR